MSPGPSELAITRLVQEHYAFLYRFAYRLSGSAHDAEDLTQQVFLAAQRHLDQLRQAERARAWLVAILRNAYRRSCHRPAPTVPLDDIPEPVLETPDDWVVDPAQLQSALAELPEEFRSVIVLYYLEHLSYREIAEMLEIPLGTVMSRLSRGKGALRRKLVPPAAAIEAVSPGEALSGAPCPSPPGSF